jgi:predicted Zn-dependent peptidase
LRTVARASGVSTSVLRDYNPELLRDRVPPTGGDYLLNIPADRVQQAVAALPAFLDHERAGSPAAGALPSTPAPSSPELVAEHEVAPDPLPPRPFPLGPNRLPEFGLPGSDNSGGRTTGVGMAALTALGAKLPVVMVGGDVGWQAKEGQAQTGLGTLGGTPAHGSAIKGRDAAIEKHLGFLSAPQAIPQSPDPFERLVLPNGITVQLRDDPAAARVAITVRIAPAGDVDRASVSASSIQGGTGEIRHTLTVPERDLDIGLNLAAGRLRLWLAEGNGAELAGLRRHAGEARRKALETTPYGPAWIALSDTLFPDGHPLAGTLAGAWEDSEFARDMLLVEALRSERVTARASVTVVGRATKERVRRLAGMFLGSIEAPDKLPIPPHPREQRITVEQAVPSERVLYGWIVPGEDDPGFLAMNVAVAILSAPKLARLDRALVEPGYAARVHQVLDIGSLASTVVIEIIPAVPHDIAEVERRMDAEIEALASAGPTTQEVVYAQSLLRLRIRKETESAGGIVATGAPRSANSARLRSMLDPKSADRFLAALAQVTPQTVRAVVRRALDRNHRVVVVTRPRGNPSAP